MSYCAYFDHCWSTTLISTTLSHSTVADSTQPLSLLAGKVADLQNDEQHFEGFGEVTDAPVYTLRKH